VTGTLLMYETWASQLARCGCEEVKPCASHTGEVDLTGVGREARDQPVA
jgi:hypothetical protein